MKKRNGCAQRGTAKAEYSIALPGNCIDRKAKATNGKSMNSKGTAQTATQRQSTAKNRYATAKDSVASFGNGIA